jgi:hypothetical protein
MQRVDWRGNPVYVDHKPGLRTSEVLQHHALQPRVSHGVRFLHRDGKGLDERAMVTYASRCLLHNVTTNSVPDVVLAPISME